MLHPLTAITAAVRASSRRSATVYARLVASVEVEAPPGRDHGVDDDGELIAAMETPRWPRRAPGCAGDADARPGQQHDGGGEGHVEGDPERVRPRRAGRVVAQRRELDHPVEPRPPTQGHCHGHQRPGEPFAARRARPVGCDQRESRRTPLHHQSRTCRSSRPAARRRSRRTRPAPRPARAADREQQPDTPRAAFGKARTLSVTAASGEAEAPVRRRSNQLRDRPGGRRSARALRGRPGAPRARACTHSG